VPHDEGSMKNFKNPLNNEIKTQPTPSSEQIDTNGGNIK